jgi:hypothetical protein
LSGVGRQGISAFDCPLSGFGGKPGGRKFIVGQVRVPFGFAQGRLCPYTISSEALHDPKHDE